MEIDLNLWTLSFHDVGVFKVAKHNNGTISISLDLSVDEMVNLTEKLIYHKNHAMDLKGTTE